MSKLVENIHIVSAVQPEAADPVSLEDLLLRQMQSLSSSEDADDLQITSTSSRRNRRKRLRSSKIVNKRKQSSNLQPTRLQEKADKSRQERNKKQLLDRQRSSKQSNQGRVGEGQQFIGTVRGSLNKQERKAEAEFRPAEFLRPVVLGTFDYDVISEEVQESLRIKRSVRKIKIDKQVEANIPYGSSIMIRPPITTSLEQYSSSYDSFFKSLDPTKLSLFNEALSAFGLSLVDGSSVTEIMYTLVKEYAHALHYTTSRLDESPAREILPGTNLTPSKSRRSELWNIFMKIAGLDSIRQFHFADNDDVEVSLKCLTSLLAKEMLFSYNAQKAKLPTSITNTLQVKYDKNVITDPKPVLDRKSAGGILFKSTVDGETALNYPLEMTQLMSDSATFTAYNFINETSQNKNTKFSALANSSLNTEEFNSPYAALSSHYSQVSDYIGSIFDTSVMTSDADTDNVSVRFLANTISWINEEIKKVAIADIGNNPTAVGAVQISSLAEASQSEGTFNRLIVYLAFRQEHIQRFSSGKEPIQPGPSTIVRRSRTLRELLGTMSSGKKETTITAKPQEFKVSPPPGSSSTSQTETFTQPERQTNLTLTQDVDDTTSTSLEELFGMSFEEVAEWFAGHLLTRLQGNNSSSIATFRTSVIPADYVAHTLKRSNLSLFDNLLRYDNSLGEMMQDDEEPFELFSVDDGSKTFFSSFIKDRVFLAYAAMCCKITDSVIEGRLVIHKPLQRAYGHSLSGAGSSSEFSANEFRTKTSQSFYSDIHALDTYLDGELSDTSAIATTFPALASVIRGVSEEEEFLSTFATSLKVFFQNLDRDFKGVSDALSTPIADKTLSDVIAAGLVPSRDIVNLFISLPWSINNEMTVYNGVRLRDKVTSDSGYTLMEDVLTKTGDTFVPRKKQKVLCIGLPAGFLENIRFTPTDIEEASAAANAEIQDENYFYVIVEKIDLADPDTQYTRQELKFSRELFVLGPGFLVVDGFSAQPTTESDISEKFGMNVISNHVADFVLKQYADLHMGLDFSETAFPIDHALAVNNSVRLPALADVDNSSLTFLSSSNMAFDPKRRSLNNYSFYNADEKSIALNQLNPKDNYAYSTFEFLNTYGNIFTADSVLRKVNSGLLFEKTICVPIDDDNFVPSYASDDRQATAEAKSRVLAQQEVGIGVETSEGIDMFTYRISVEMRKEGTQ